MPSDRNPKPLSYKIEIVGMFAYSSRTEKPICPKVGMLISWTQKDILERSKLRKSVLGSSPGKDGFCSSEAKHDRRTAPRLKLFQRGDFMNQGHNSEKLSWVRVPARMVSEARKLSTIEERRQD
jgi:hypothetical protein